MIDARVAGLLLNTLAYAAGTCAVSLPLGTLLALLLVKTNMPGRKVCAALLSAMLFVPLSMQAAAWMAGFAGQGWFPLGPGESPLLAQGRGAIWVHAMAAVPWVTLLVGVSLRAVEPQLEEETLLEVSPFQVLWRVTLRRAAGGIVAAAIWVIVWCAAETTITDLFQVRTFAEEIHLTYYLGGWMPKEWQLEQSQVEGGDGAENLESDGWAGQGGVNVATGMMLLSLLVVLALLLCQKLSSRASDGQSGDRWIAKFGRGRWVALLSTVFLLLVLIGVPIANLMVKTGVTVTRSEAGFVRGWSLEKLVSMTCTSGGRYAEEIRWSLAMASTSATAALAIGLGLAWRAVDRGRRGESSWRQTLAQPALWVATLGFALPAPMLGVGLIYGTNLFGPDAPRWLTYLVDRTIAAPVLVQTARILPLAILILWHAFSTLPRAMLESAECEGAGSFRRLFSIALLNRIGAMLMAWLVCFALALGELSATVLVTPPGIEPLTVRIFSLLHYGMEDHVSSICLAFWGGYLVLAMLGAAAIFLWKRNSPQPKSPK